MHVLIFPTAERANHAAADLLAGTLTAPETRNLVVAGGNTPLPVYALVAVRRLPLGHLRVFVLDEYVGVPPPDPRTCTNLLRRTVAEAWGVPAGQFFGLDPNPDRAAAEVQALEERLAAAGGVHVAVLGLGANGHLGFNEPGSAPDSPARVVDLEPGSVEANRRWFGGEHAPARGATLGLKTLLAARRVLVLAYGPAKAAAVRALVAGPMGAHCPASFLQAHPDAWLFTDTAAAADLSGAGK
jgi:glucosamine-6-phosphate deaminase